MVSTRKTVALTLLLALGITGCGTDSEPGGAEESTNTQEIEQEFRNLAKGTIEATGTDPATLRFLDNSDFSYEQFATMNPASRCSPEDTEDSDQEQGRYMITVESKGNDKIYTVEEYEAKSSAVWDYWKSQGLEPETSTMQGNAKSISAKTPSGGRVSYLVSLYGDLISTESACSTNITPPNNNTDQETPSQETTNPST